MKFGIVGCGVLNQTLNARSFIPGVFAISLKLRAIGFGDKNSSFVTEWHSAHTFSAKLRPASGSPNCCAMAFGASAIMTINACKIVIFIFFP